MNRRGLLVGLFMAPAIIRTPGLLMPIKPLIMTAAMSEAGVAACRFMGIDPARVRDDGRALYLRPHDYWLGASNLSKKFEHCTTESPLKGFVHTIANRTLVLET